uniref:GYY secreted salivary protein n=1 Tax=Ornithodoros parkeri TaxID=140564 RepID=A6NA19_ORNPR|nr:GYY secreted salivary protein [Ornithodoros parkeri]
MNAAFLVLLVVALAVAVVTAAPQYLVSGYYGYPYAPSVGYYYHSYYPYHHYLGR